MINCVYKQLLIIVYSIAVILFVHFLTISHIFNALVDRLANGVEDLQVYDYIIVGAGSAGAILASNLADAGHQILLIEAGGPAPWFADIPILAPLLQQSPYDWQYETVPQEQACKGLINNQSKWPTGKILGGSSRLNSMAYVKGHPSDYSDWFPDYNNFARDGDNSTTSKSPWCSELCSLILSGVEEILRQTNLPDNYSLEFSPVTVSSTNGERWSTDRLLLKPRSNLKILTHAFVEKVLFNANKAEGVRFRKWGRHFSARANKIIVSAGAVGTPKLLMLSGVGPRAHLSSLNIDVVADLPVGEHLVDHIITGIDLVTVNASLSVGLGAVLSSASALNYFLRRQGPWTSSGIEVVGTLHEGSENQPPELQFMVLPVGVSQDGGSTLRKLMGISDKIFDEYFRPLIFQTAITIAPVLLHPKSRGHVRLRSADPLDTPIIDPKYLSHKDDVSVLVKGIRFIEQLIKTDSMRAVGASMYKKPFPGCEKFDFAGTEYWECYIRHLTLTTYHPAGTCRLGSVVNQSFGVFNTENLYIVDASVLPRLPSGNINAAVMMLAEKASTLFIKSVISEKCSRNDFIAYTFFSFSRRKVFCELTLDFV